MKHVVAGVTTFTCPACSVVRVIASMPHEGESLLCLACKRVTTFGVAHTYVTSEPDPTTGSLVTQAEKARRYDQLMQLHAAQQEATRACVALHEEAHRAVSDSGLAGEYDQGAVAYWSHRARPLFEAAERARRALDDQIAAWAQEDALS